MGDPMPLASHAVAAPADAAGASTQPENRASSYAPSSDSSFDSSSASPSAAQPTPTAAEPKGVPEAVFTSHLMTSELFDAAASADDPRAWSLTCGGEPGVTADLVYTVDGGAISSLELRVPFAPEYDAKSESSIERYLAEAEDRTEQARADAIRALLPDLLPACDRNDALSRASVRIWTEEALNLSSEEDDYTQKQGGCTFYAYRMQRDGRDWLVCLLFFEA